MQANPTLDYISQSPAQTHLAGEHLGSLCTGGEVICLSGPLGSGKTVLAQGIAAGLCVTAQVTSPTFTVLKEYRGRLDFFHFDFYRFEHQVRTADIEFGEYLRPDAVCAVEWAEFAAELLPEEYLLVKVGLVSTSKRAIQVFAQGTSYEEFAHRSQALAFHI